MSNGFAQDGDAREMDHIKNLVNEILAAFRYSVITLILLLLLISLVVYLASGYSK
jgi:multisubunit Na+/H+ antiporter MnhB subunit